jgi:predicted secreted protein
MHSKTKSGCTGIAALAFRVCLAAGLFGAIAGAPSSVRAAPSGGQSVSLPVGASRTITLSENRSTGYRWRLDAEHSANSAIVDVIDAGSESGQSGVPGAPGSHRWRIEARAPGTARIVLVYSRAWEQGAPADTYTVDVKVTRAQGK